jgi:ammonium transporter, Amt family
MSAYDSGSIAWVMAASTTIMLMAPGIALFYGGLVNKKNLLSIIAFSILIFSVSTITWGLVGFSLAFGNPNIASGFIGDCIYCGLRYISDTKTNPFSSNVTFQTYFFLEMLYAGVAGVIVITPFIGRLRTIYLILIAISYQLIIYSPITYWIRSPNGWLNKMGVIDFSGGTMVHLTSGFAAYALFKMIGLGKNQLQHQNSTSTISTLIGTVFIWYSSFGFNGAAALISGTPAAAALINTQLAGAGGAIGWTFTQYIFTDRGKINGWCSGLICGLVSITPCSGYVSLWSSTVIGAIAAIIIYIYCHVKSDQNNEIPDTLGIFSGHGISAFWGIICAGAFSTLESGNTY